MKRTALHDYLTAASELYPCRAAVEEPGFAAVSYRELMQLSDRLRDRLTALGVCPGDRVGVYMRKSTDAVASIFGILKTGAAYIPLDASAPTARNAFIMNDCAARAIIVEDRFADRLQQQIQELGGRISFLTLNGAGGGESLRQALNREDATGIAPAVNTISPQPQDLAYILYTSGSTGRPKGVMLSHGNAVSFVEWCSETFQPRAEDRFSSHAPFHFDLSILDIYVPVKHGAALVLISEDTGKDPVRLAQLLSDQRISVWYSAPSILSLLAQYGSLSKYGFDALRIVLFAGEVFPVKHLRTLKAFWPKPRYFNLYGPTETNVCTFFEIPAIIPEERTMPYPIGKTCSHLQTRVVNEQGKDVAIGEEGELCVRGLGVMQGYWNLPEQNGRAFFKGPLGDFWYKTGDIVYEAEDHNYIYIGRRDRMVKRRGYRIELGDIEAGLYLHPAVKEAAVIALPDGESEIKIKAFLRCRETKHPSTIELKRFCADHLPLYMVPDVFVWPDELPRTSTDKTDYQRLKEMA